MKKSLKRGRSRRPLGRTPVIAVRVEASLYRQIQDETKRSEHRTMSDATGALLRSAFEWRAAFVEAKDLTAQFHARIKEDLLGEMQRQGWKRHHGSLAWWPPGAVPPSGFIKEVDPVEAVVKQLEQCVAILKATAEKGDVS